MGKTKILQESQKVLEAYTESIRQPLLLEIDRMNRINEKLIAEISELLEIESEKALPVNADVMIALLREEWGRVKVADVEKQIGFFKRVGAAFGITHSGDYNKKLKVFLSRAYGRKIIPLLILLDEQSLAKHLNEVQYPSECTKGFLISIIKKPFYPTNGDYNSFDRYLENGGKLIVNEHFTYVPYSELAKSPHWNDADVFGTFISILGTEEMGAKYKNYKYVIKMACDAYINDVDKLNKIATVLATSEICKKCAMDSNWWGEMARLAYVCINSSPQAAKKLIGWATTGDSNELTHISKFPIDLRKEFFAKWDIDSLVDFLKKSTSNHQVLPIEMFAEIVKEKTIANTGA